MTKGKSAQKKAKEFKIFFKNLSKNYWAISTIALAILLIATVTLLSDGITCAVISPEEAGQRVLDFANNQGANAELLSTADGETLYEVILLISGQEAPVYVTKDGKVLVPQPISLVTETNTNPQTSSAETEIPKSDNPEVGLYIWSYCPYGVTALAPFAEVASLLDANFKVFLYYSGHGDFEIQQNKIQACIQDLGYKNYWTYTETFASNIYEKCSGDINCDLVESTKLMDSLGIDSEKVLSCVETNGETLLEAHYNAAKEVGVTGSPSLVINGVKIKVERTAEAYKIAVCSAFNKAPKECGETLDSTVATAQGNC